MTQYSRILTIAVSAGFLGLAAAANTKNRARDGE